MGAAVITAGTAAPLGATVLSRGVNFSVFAKSATAVELLLFDDIHRFVRSLNAFRQHRDVVRGDTTFTLNELLNRARVDWHGVRLNQPDWNEHSHSLAFTLQSLHARYLLHGMLNAYWEPLTFELPPVPAGHQPWQRCLDTALASPDDICPWGKAPCVRQASYVVAHRSVVVLLRPLQTASDALSHVVSQ